MTFVLAGCSSGDGRSPSAKGANVEGVEVSVSGGGRTRCGGQASGSYRLYRATNSSLAWLDQGSDGTIEAILSAGNVYLRDPTATATTSAERWIEVPYERDDVMFRFASRLRPWLWLHGVFDYWDLYLPRFQQRQDRGEKSPVTETDGSISSWETDQDGRVIEATVKFTPEQGGATMSMRQISPELASRPKVPDHAALLEGEPVADYLPMSLEIDPACGTTSKDELAAARACLDAAMVGKTVREWISTHLQYAMSAIPKECT